MTTKNWDEILKDYSDGEDSDAGDTLNVRMVQKHAPRVAELVGQVFGASDARPPMGMNSMAKLSEGLFAANDGASPRSPLPGGGAAPPPPVAAEATTKTDEPVRSPPTLSSQTEV